MEMAMVVWLNNSDGLRVHACIMERQACERGKGCMVRLVWVQASSERMNKEGLLCIYMEQTDL